MRKIFTIISVVLLWSNAAKAQYVIIPDADFRNYLRNLYPTCFNAEDQMDTTSSEIVNEDTLVVTNIFATTLAGLQYFKHLNFLICDNLNQLSTIPELPSTLKHLKFNGVQINGLTSLPPGLEYLDCSSCYQLLSLPPLPQTLKTLICNFCNLTSLPALPAGLQFLFCHNNKLSSLPALPASLEYLNFAYNDSIAVIPALPTGLKNLYCNNSRGLITSLPTLPDSLVQLDCTGNQIISLPPLPPNLSGLYCGRNLLQSLPTIPNSLLFLSFFNNQVHTFPSLPATLTYLDCGQNPLYTIPELPDSLKNLSCYSDSLTMLPALPSQLINLHCGDNQLIHLPILPNSLQRVQCQLNHLNGLPDFPSSLDFLDCTRNNIYCLPLLPNRTDYMNDLSIYIDKDKIKCIANRPPYVSLHLLDSTGMYFGTILPLCNPTNNINNCQSFPVMQGVVYVDNNNNGIKDTTEPVRRNVEVTLSSGKFTFTNTSGLYEIGADTIGTHNITITPPRYFNVSPATVPYNFTTYDTLVIQNIALQADTTIDEFSLIIIPVTWAARPGFSYPYHISYENTGTTTLSSNIVFDYDQTKLNYNTSSEAGVVDNADNLAFNTGSLTPGQSGSFIGYFTLKTTVPLGDTLNAKAIINANAFTAYDSVQTIVRGAFDPNDKQATEQLSPSQVASGKYIDYTIRFQNTGTDTAFNIVISDTLNSDLQAGSLEMIATSHNCKTTVNNNIVFFEFLNILLPDSNVNEPMSHGFVSFRIKPQSNVAVNTTIPNKAAIYFDYNAPVVTNTAGTLIKDFTVIPLKLLSFSAVPQNDNTFSLYWNTANEINTKHFAIESSDDGRHFSQVTTVIAKGGANNNYAANVAERNNSLFYYRLKIIDKEGSFIYSPIIKIDKRKYTGGFSILSNPVKDFITISTTDRTLHNTIASIINVQGAVVKTFIIKEGSQAVDIEGFPTGIYYLHTINGSQKILVK